MTNNLKWILLLLFGGSVIGALIWYDHYHCETCKEAGKLSVVMAPAKWDTTPLRPYLEPAPTQTMTGYVKVRSPKKINIEPFLTTIDSLKKVIDEKDRIARVILKDSFGGTHNIVFTPKLKKFVEKFTPMLQVKPQTITHTVYVPEPIVVPKSESFWIVGHLGTNGNFGYGGSLGYGKFGAGLMFFRQASTLYFVSFKFDF